MARPQSVLSSEVLLYNNYFNMGMQNKNNNNNNDQARFLTFTFSIDIMLLDFFIFFLQRSHSIAMFAAHALLITGATYQVYGIIVISKSNILCTKISSSIQ